MVHASPQVITLINKVVHPYRSMLDPGRGLVKEVYLVRRKVVFTRWGI